MHLNHTYSGGVNAADTSSRPLGVKYKNVIRHNNIIGKRDWDISKVAKCQRKAQKHLERKSTDDEPLARIEIGPIWIATYRRNRVAGKSQI